MTLSKTLISGVTTAALVASPLVAFAQTNVGGSVNANVNAGAQVNVSAHASTTGQSDAVTKAKERADQEIDRRIANLNQFLSRVNAMQRVDATFKATLATEVQGQITDLTNLKTTIDADTNTATLKPEIQSITKSYRIYALVLPQAAIGAAADRTQTLVAMFQTLGAKLQSRIASSTSDTSQAMTAMTDFNAKVADAQVQATAAINHIANLKPDNGDKATMQSNKDQLSKARADIKVAMQDFADARKDAATIMSSLNGSAAVNASTTVNH